MLLFESSPCSSSYVSHKTKKINLNILLASYKFVYNMQLKKRGKLPVMSGAYKCDGRSSSVEFRLVCMKVTLGYSIWNHTRVMDKLSRQLGYRYFLNFILVKLFAVNNNRNQLKIKGIKACSSKQSMTVCRSIKTKMYYCHWRLTLASISFERPRRHSKF